MPKMLERPSKATLARRRKFVEARARAFGQAIQRWMTAYVRDVIETELRRAGKGASVSMPRAKGKREQQKMERDLARIFRTYSLRMVKDAGQSAVGVRPSGGTQAVKDFLATKPIKITRLAKATRDRVIKTVRDILIKAEDETPQPTVAQIAQRIRDKFDGDDSFAFTVTPARAELIARTELAQAQNTGIVEGYREIGIKRMEWLAYNDGRSGDRRHDRMDGQIVEVGKPFTNPTTGVKLRYPGDPSAPISETANCRCTVAAVD